jgi:transcriptional regulator with XRE-family HTH domain
MSTTIASQHRTASNPSDNPAGRPRATDVDRRIGARIRDRRILLGLTQHQLAELIGVSYQQAHKYEKGLNRISGERLLTIAEALKLSVSDLLTGLERPVTISRRMQQQVDTAALLGRLDDRKAAAVATLVRALAGEPESD